MFLTPFCTTDFRNKLSIVDLLSYNFVHKRKTIFPSTLTRSVPKDLSQQKQLVIQKWINRGFDNKRNRSTILSRNVSLFPRKPFRAHLKKGGLYERIGGAKWAMNFWGVEDHSVIPISGTRGCLVHISGRPRVRAGKIKKESGKQFHFPFMLGKL